MAKVFLGADMGGFQPAPSVLEASISGAAGGIILCRFGPQARGLGLRSDVAAWLLGPADKTKTLKETAR